MLDANPLRDGTMHPPVNIPRDARGGPAHRANLCLKDRRRVHNDYLAFRFWIDGKLAKPPSKTSQKSALVFFFFSIGLKNKSKVTPRTFWWTCGGRSDMTAPAMAPEATMPARGLRPPSAKLFNAHYS